MAPPPAPPRASRGRDPPPYKSKTCLGAMFYGKSLEDSGVPPVCVGVQYGNTTEAPANAIGDGDGPESHTTTDELGAFKFTCVGYGQRAYPYFPDDNDSADGGGDDGGGRKRRNRLPHCVGLQILVADSKSHEDRRAADPAAWEKAGWEDFAERRNRGHADDPEVRAFFERLRVEKMKELMEEQRRRERSDAFPFVSADFEKKFTKTAGKMLSNMKKHAEYIAKLAGISGQR